MNAVKATAVAAAVAVTALAGCTSSQTGTTGTTAASACISAYTAGSQYAAGQRSLDSTMSALRKAESDERQAAGQDPKYQTVVDDIVGLEADLAGGGGDHLRLLSEDCGAAHG